MVPTRCFLPALLTLSFAAAAQPVAIEPVKVDFDKRWMADMQRQAPSRGWLREEDGQAIAADVAQSMREALERAVRARGIDVAPGASPGVRRLAARIDDLYVNAPDVQAPGHSATFVREAGRATLRVDICPSEGGAPCYEWMREGTAGPTGRFVRATSVTNRFWFDAMFRRWADELAADLSTSAKR